MNDRKPPAPVLLGADDSLSTTANLRILGKAAESFRRVARGDTRKEDGSKSIWHRGKMQTEMLTWEDANEKIVRQELSFLGMVIEYRRGQMVRTGAWPQAEEDTGAGSAKSHLISFHKTPSLKILDYASHLLKQVPKRDYYSQHLLKHVNSTISMLGYDDEKTAVANLHAYAKQAPTPHEQASPKRRKKKTKKDPRATQSSADGLPMWFVVSALVLIAGCAAALLWLIT